MRGMSQILLLIMTTVVLLAALTFFLLPEVADDLVLYCGVDQDQSQPMVERFTEKTGLSATYFGESEAFRSIGLPKRLLREKDAPQADVYWSNEIMHMVDLVEAGVIAPLPEGLAARFPEKWRDPKGHFLMFGARARVFLVNVDLLPDPATHPKRVEDLLAPRYGEMGLFTCMAAPLTGTTYTHAVALLTKDETAAQAFFDRAAKAGAKGEMKIVASNGRVMRAVSDSTQKVAFGLTDTDDAYIAIKKMKDGTGPKVLVIYPDQGEGGAGALLIPNTAGLVAKGPRPEAGAKFLDWLSSADVERELAAGPSAQIPVRPDVSPVPDHVKRPPTDFRAMDVDWYAVGANVNKWHDYLTQLFRPAN